MKIGVIGTGYVGLTTGICLAELGNKVCCVDKKKRKIEDLKKGKIPIYEPGLKELLDKNKSRVSFTTDTKKCVESAEVIYIAVGTPAKPTGEADITQIEEVSRDIAGVLNDYKVIVEKSTVPVKTGEWVKRTIKLNVPQEVDFDVVSNPEFLREGSAIDDFLHPDRILLGVESKRAKNIMMELYKPLNAPFVITDIKSAEIIKHAANSFLALKISYINAIANICELVNADVISVAEGMGYDKRIGRQFLDAGIGYGGSCFPKDVSAFIKITEEFGYDFELLKIVEKINREQRKNFIRKIKKSLWILKNKTICVLGLSFKPNTDDIREAPSIDIIEALLKEGAHIKAYDPAAVARTREIFKEIDYKDNPYDAASESDALLILTEWDEFKNLDLKKIKEVMHQPIIVDGRNIFDPKKMAEMGFTYASIGR